jgi:hypothetical protein
MNITEWGRKQGLKDIHRKIEKIIKNKRLVFLGDNHVLYIGKDNKRREYNFDQFVQVAIDVGGWQKNMTILSITNLDIVNILEELYAKQKKEAK